MFYVYCFFVEIRIRFSHKKWVWTIPRSNENTNENKMSGSTYLRYVLIKLWSTISDKNFKQIQMGVLFCYSTELKVDI